MANKIIIIGLGAGSFDSLSLKAYKLLKNAQRLYLRTEKHPLVKDLVAEGIKFQSFDYIYEEENTFEEVYQKISKTIFDEAGKSEIVYAVPGHPMVAESTVEELISMCDKFGLPYEIVGSESFLDALFVALKIDPVKGINIIDALSLDQQKPLLSVGNIITQVYNQTIASEVKLNLMEHYPDEQKITVIRAAGIPKEERIEEVALFDLDRLPWIDYLTSVYVPPYATDNSNSRFPLDPLVDVLAQLRGEDGCPWDREQSHESLKRYLLEETYEVLEAIDDGNMHKICEELGDLLLQIVFHAQIARENLQFDMNDVILEITEKMVRRHPHVFGDVQASTSKDVEINWEAIKKKEKGAEEHETSYLDGVPKGMPAMLTAEKLQQKAAKVGFDWPDYHGVLAKVEEEITELKEAIRENHLEEVKKELGDVFFAVVNICRMLKISPEESLMGTNRKFYNRFRYIEEQCKLKNLNLTELELSELDKFWDQAKAKGL